MAAHREGHLHRQSAGAGRRHRPGRGVRRSRPDRELKEGREMTTTQNPAPAKTSRAPAAAPRGRPRLTGDLLIRYAFVFPALIYMIAFFGYPIIKNVVMSFQAYDFTTFFNGHAPFIGFDNYAATFSDPIFLRALGNTALFTIGSIIGQFVIRMGDRKSTRLNSSHVAISYAVFCL